MKSSLGVLLLANLFCLVSVSLLFAQQDKLPATDIYLLEISKDKRGDLVFENPARITRNENYDNEPWWYPDGSAILYAAISDSSAGDTSKADIYKYDINSHKTRA